MNEGVILNIVKYLGKTRDVTRFMSTHRWLYYGYLAANSEGEERLWETLKSVTPLQCPLPALSAKGAIFEKERYMREFVMNEQGPIPSTLMETTLEPFSGPGGVALRWTGSSLDVGHF